jgi:hypothetical protein
MSRNMRNRRGQALANKPQLRLRVVQNIRLARRNWKVSAEQVGVLKGLTEELQLSVAVGDLRLLDGRWYVTHAGLLRVARRSHCSGIQVQALREFSNPATSRWVFKATVYKAPGSKGFVGYGDADPSNVSPLVRGAEMRVAETRAVNRALRKAYGIGLCSVEEIGAFPSSFDSSREKQNASRSLSGNGSGNGQPRLRDQLCLLIRKHQLDPTLVKRYAAEFCGTAALRDASRDLVESFITHLGEWAARDREGLLCKLTSFAETQEANS